MPTLSVIVPVYKVEAYLDRCVQSIVQQTFKDFELILVDDGSPDNCGKMCDEWIKKDNRVVVIHKENGGLSSARNAGLDVAKGEYIGFVDSDDYISVDMYEYLYTNILQHDAEISVCGIFDCYGRTKKARCQERMEVVMCKEDAIRNSFKQYVMTVNAVTKLYKKRIFDDLRFPIGKTSEDAYVIVDILLNANNIFVSTIPKYYYVRREDSITMGEFSGNDLYVLDAFEHNMELIYRECPQLSDVGQYGVWWANRYLLNRLAFSGKEVKKNNLAIIRKCSGEIHRDIVKILKNKNHTFNHKIAYLLIWISPGLYMYVFKHFGTM